MTRTMTLTLALALAGGGGAVGEEAEAPDAFAWPGGARAAVALTYDDGLDTHLDHAAPDLDAAGLHGTFYVPGTSQSLARRLSEWRALAERGHELGNHALFHPCLRNPPGGGDRTWVRDEYALEGYTIPRIVDEVGVMNTLLHALDGRTVRTLAYNCADTVAGGESYVDAMRPLFVAARIGDDTIAKDAVSLDPFLVPSWMVENVTGERMIAFVKEAVDAGGLAVFMFHGVGGEHIAVSREAHQELLAWLAAHRDAVWTDTFLNVMTHVLEKRESASPTP